MAVSVGLPGWWACESFPVEIQATKGCHRSCVLHDEGASLVMRTFPQQHPLREPLTWCFCAASFLFIVIKAPNMKLSVFTISKCPRSRVRYIHVVCSLSRTFRGAHPAPHPYSLMTLRCL